MHLTVAIPQSVNVTLVTSAAIRLRPETLVGASCSTNGGWGWIGRVRHEGVKSLVDARGCSGADFPRVEVRSHCF